MLTVIKNMGQLNFGALMQVYAQSNRESAEERYAREPEAVGMRLAEADFYQYLRECFFVTPGAFYAVWGCGGRYISALRMEPYRDGLLLEALETALEERKKGNAGKLIKAVLAAVPGQKVYSHIHRNNRASIRAHEACGFRRVLDYAVYADGSVLPNSITMVFEA